ncbi:MAG: hypothetical protein V4593_08115 [Pseudomonadota bacterium]
MSERNHIARTVRALPAIAGLSELWQQRTADGESDAEYADFLDWLDRGSERGGPPARCVTAAARHEWAERALAYERAWDLARADEANGGTIPEHQITSNLTRMVQIEVAKLLKQSASEVGPVVPLKDLLHTVSLIKDLTAAGVAAASAKTDLSKLTPDELKAVLTAQRILQQTTRK